MENPGGLMPKIEIREARDVFLWFGAVLIIIGISVMITAVTSTFIYLSLMGIVLFFFGTVFLFVFYQRKAVSETNPNKQLPKPTLPFTPRIYHVVCFGIEWKVETYPKFFSNANLWVDLYPECSNQCPGTIGWDQSSWTLNIFLECNRCGKEYKTKRKTIEQVQMEVFGELKAQLKEHGEEVIYGYPR